MAHIETRRLARGVSFRVSWLQDGAKQSETFGDYGDAERFAFDVTQAGNRWPAGYQRGVGDGAVPRCTERLDLPTVLEHCIAYTKSRHTKAGPEHRQKMERTFRASLADLADMPIDRVTRDDVQNWVDELCEQLAYKTVKERRGMLSSAYKAAILEGHRADNPVFGTVINLDPEAGPARHVFLKTWEVETIFASIPRLHLPYVETLVRTGIRPGEAFALRVGDVDLDGPLPAIIIDKARKHAHNGNHRIGAPKTRAGRRTVTIDPDLAEILRGHIGQRPATDYLFAEHGNDGTWQRNIWVPAVKAAMLPRDQQPRVYDLRHTHASLTLANGGTLFALSKRLGHKDITTTANIYGHLDRAGDAVNAEITAKVFARKLPLRVVVD